MENKKDMNQDLNKQGQVGGQEKIGQDREKIGQDREKIGQERQGGQQEPHKKL